MLPRKGVSKQSDRKWKPSGGCDDAEASGRSEGAWSGEFIPAAGCETLLQRLAQMVFVDGLSPGTSLCNGWGHQKGRCLCGLRTPQGMGLSQPLQAGRNVLSKQDVLNLVQADSGRCGLQALETYTARS